VDTTEFTPEGVAKASFKYFFTKILGYKWNRWYEAVYQDIALLRLLVQVSRGHGKTVFFASYAVWLVYSEQPVDILFVSYSEEQVKLNIMNLIDKIIMNNDHLAHLRPSSKQMWGAQLKTFSTGAQIRGESFGSSVRGAHPTHLFVDDPLKDRGGMTPEEQYNYYMTSLMGTCRRDTQVVVDGTPLDPNDLLEQLESNAAYKCHKFPALDEGGNPLFPELFTKEDLQKKLDEVGSFAFSREFLLQRLDPKTQVFKDQYRTINTDLDFPTFAYVRTLIDPAISEKEAACDSAIVTVGVDKHNHIWELDTRLIRSDDPSLILKDILKVVSLYKSVCYDYMVVIEGQVFQKVLAYDLRQKLIETGLDVGVLEVTHSGNLGKSQRIIGLQVKWEGRAIHLLPESPIIAQARYFRPNAKGLRIDALDALSFINLNDVGGPAYDVEPFDPGVPPDAAD
jgi:hypothetical protein